MDTCPFCGVTLCSTSDFGKHFQQFHQCAKCLKFKKECKCSVKCSKPGCPKQFSALEDMENHLLGEHICFVCDGDAANCTCMDTLFEESQEIVTSGRKRPREEVPTTSKRVKIAPEPVPEQLLQPVPNQQSEFMPEPPIQHGIELVENIADADGIGEGSNPDTVTVSLLRSKKCETCDILFPSTYSLQIHLITVHPEFYDDVDIPQSGMGIEQLDISLKQNAFDIYHGFECNLDHLDVKDIREIFHSLRKQILALFNQYLKDWNTFKFHFDIEVGFSKKQKDESYQHDQRPFPGFMFPIMNIDNAKVAMKVTTEHFAERLQEHVRNGSGWIIEKIKNFKMTIIKYNPLCGARKNIPMPDILKNKSRTFINVAVDDNFCFKRSIYAHPEIHGRKIDKTHINRTLESVQFYEGLLDNGRVNWDGINFPFSLNQVRKFERQNVDIGLTIIGYSKEFSEKKKSMKHKLDDENNYDDIIESVAINVMSDNEEDEIAARPVGKKKSYRQSQVEIVEYCVPLHVCKEDRKIKIDLLLIMDEGEEDHFVFIKDMSKLLYKHNSKYTCRHCLHGFNDDYDEHVKYCSALPNSEIKTVFPEESHLKFNKFCRTQMSPFTVIADFESFLKPTGKFLEVKVSDKNKKNPNTVRVQLHKASGFSWRCINWKGIQESSSFYRVDSDDDDAPKRFLTEILALNEELQEEMKGFEKEAKKTMVISKENNDMFTNPHKLCRKTCYFCHKGFTMKEFKEKQIVKHHEHLPPYNYIGPAHKKCNIEASTPKTLTVCFHNLRGYDGHFIIKAASEELVKEIEVIPQTSEKFMSIIINKQIKFIDTALFMPESLGDLAKDLKEYPITRQAFSQYSKEKVDLLLNKGAYPYSYMDSIDKFQETELPSKTAFKNDLTGQEIDDKVYENAQKVWKEFGIKNMGEWHDLYVQLDTALLADVWFDLRELMYEKFTLDVCHYFSLPMFSLDAALKSTQVELEFIKDPTMHVWLEGAIRGGLVSVGDLRAARANNKYCPGYDEKKPSSFIMYWDANNLYGHALSQYLPHKGFRWATEKEMEDIRKDPKAFVLGMGDQDNTCMFFEVDLHIPEDKHDFLNAYPPAPISRKVQDDDISNIQHDLADVLDVKVDGRQKRLIADLKDKEGYVCHYRALKTYLNIGAEIKFVRKVMVCEQSPWMEPFVTANTEKRKAATTELRKRFWKLLNNTGYGKLIEQKRQRTKMHIVLNKEKGMRLNSRPNVAHASIIDDRIVLLTMKRVQVTLDRPIAAGIAVLDISKTTMFRFHYDFIAKVYPGKHNLLYTDTDSMIYLIKSDNVYDDCQKYGKDVFDMSDYNPADPILGKYSDQTNKKKLAYFTDESPQAVITEFVCTKPKAYCCQTRTTQDISNNVLSYNSKKRLKGVSKSAVKNDITFKDFVNALCPENVDDAQTYAVNKGFRSYNHDIFTIDFQKKAINGLDLKRYSPDNIVTLAYGHKDIKLYEEDKVYNVDINIKTFKKDARKFCAAFVDSFY